VLDRAGLRNYSNRMKKYKKLNEPNIFEMVVPFGDAVPGADDLFDDCPTCLKLREQIKTGEVEEIIIPDDYRD
jgi:hypothetical protein